MSGEEQKLQALFSELKVADEQNTPRFAGVWNRAQLEPRRVWLINPAFVGVTALIVCALISLAVWSRFAASKPGQPSVVKNDPASNGPERVAVTPATAPAPQPPKPSVEPTERKIATGRRLISRRNTLLAEANRKLTQDAKTISSWQSPTTALLSSPSGEIFTSLPQVNQNSSDLKSFLTRSN